MLPRIVTRYFVFNRQSQAGRSARWVKVKALECSENCKLYHPLIRSDSSIHGTMYTQDHSRRDAAGSSHVQHSSGPTKLPHARCVPARTMVQHWSTCWRAQHCFIFTVLLRTNKLRREEPGFDGVAHASMLGASAIPILQGTRDVSRGVGRTDIGLDFYGAPGTAVYQCLA